MSRRIPFALLASLAALAWGPAGAQAQADMPTLSADPPKGIDAPASGRTELPNTGVESWLLALLGAGVLASGAGLRLLAPRE